MDESLKTILAGEISAATQRNVAEAVGPVRSGHEGCRIDFGNAGVSKAVDYESQIFS